MKNLGLLLLLFPIILFSCSGDEPAVIPSEEVGSSEIVITGDVSKTFAYESEFLGSISTVDPGFSSTELHFGNIGQTESAFRISLIEFGNKQGFTPGTYNFDIDPDAQLILLGTYIDDVTSYSINLTATLTNRLVLTEVNDTKVIGEFEFNLESPDGAKIKLVGTFKSIGETFKI